MTSTTPLSEDEINERRAAYEALNLGALGMSADMVSKAIDAHLAADESGYDQATDCFQCNEVHDRKTPAVSWHDEGGRMGVLGACRRCKTS